ncbi:coiled-coil domain-containing protein 97 isoform X1 [Erpetoichthys calabaricus]|uniref:Coiled-coil domain containing 97 n=1 Tax=Erpetoichthys calabaricus TaxID=27687 RepID=A0A8C4RGA5_ERPCA|nr:coiled-coil domain-containing protein 97 isoform X1 [Erpetoichthys calabaricus]
MISAHWGEIEAPVSPAVPGCVKFQTSQDEESDPACWNLQDNGHSVAEPCSVPNDSNEELSESLLEGEESKKDTLTIMLESIAKSGAQIKSQQKGEPDLTLGEKLGILNELYHSKPLIFLERYYRHLQPEHLTCFQHLAGSYEVEFYCAEIHRNNSQKNSRTRIKNKRYAALQGLIREGEYFSDERMRSRDPLLYEQCIGQYLTDDEMMEQNARSMSESRCLSDVLLSSYQEQLIQRKMELQQEREEGAEEEEEEEEEDDDEENEQDGPAGSMETEWVPTAEEKVMLREEFISRMHQRFLDGEDRDFNYSEVDDNPEYDNLEIVNQDAEERYFDEEEDSDGDMCE